MHLRLTVIIAISMCAAFFASLSQAGDYSNERPAVTGYGSKAPAGTVAENMATGEAEKGLPPAQAGPFWTYISTTNPYLKWDFWPGHEGFYPGRFPHGTFLKLYANDIAMEAARAGRRDMPYGAILVKENYGTDRKTLLAITAMYKVKGYNLEAGDWYWTKCGPDGTVLAEGKVEGCINCHRSAMTSDWVFTQPK